jgi:hypothetical protein
MRQWFKSEMHPNMQVYVELVESTEADGMPRLEPQLLGFVQAGKSSIQRAFVYWPEPVEVKVSVICNVWQAKMAVQSKIKSIEDANKL